jgi:hypothetical protein
MVGTVRTRRTHYDVLGLKPAATGDEIARAFAREMGAFRPHSIGGLTEVTLAHETLRDPAKRLAYDASLGLQPKPRPAQLLAWSGVGHASFGGSAFVARQQPVAPLAASPVAQPAAANPPPEAPANPPAPPEPVAETTPFIAAALRELARPEPLGDAARTSWPQAEPPQAGPAPESPTGAKYDLRPALDEQLVAAEDAEEGAVPWKRAAIAGGALVVAVVLVGAWAGWNSGDGVESKPAVNIALPPSTTFTVADPAAAASAPAPIVEDAQPVQSKHRTLAQPRAAHPRPAPRLAELERQISELPQSESAAPQAVATEQAVAAAPATAVAASMPLSSGVVARTIHRIGYPCGQVSSTVAGGAPGVFTVTCTSGHSYQAAPVHGRYRFRRIGGR